MARWYESINIKFGVKLCTHYIKKMNNNKNENKTVIKVLFMIWSRFGGLEPLSPCNCILNAKYMLISREYLYVCECEIIYSNALRIENNKLPHDVYNFMHMYAITTRVCVCVSP